MPPAPSSDTRSCPTGNAAYSPAVNGSASLAYAPSPGGVGNVAAVSLIAPSSSVITVAPPGKNTTLPATVQSPDVSVIEVTVAGVPLVRDIAPPDPTLDDTYSPILPAVALSGRVVPGS